MKLKHDNKSIFLIAIPIYLIIGLIFVVNDANIAYHQLVLNELRREQPDQMTLWPYWEARCIGFASVNSDDGVGITNTESQLAGWCYNSDGQFVNYTPNETYWLTNMYVSSTELACKPLNSILQWPMRAVGYHCLI